ncbi:MAG: AN1-type zinc finger domain-containing protein [Candidatus Odinarchaeota archaeon]
MTNCYYCKTKIGDIPYRCKFCGMIFCNKHRLPENHLCPFDLRRKSINRNSLTDSHLLYQDALDFMNGRLTVDKIYNYVTTKSMSKSEAINLLSNFIENSNDNEIRKMSILAFKELELKDDKVFDVLESCLLSDEDLEIKKNAKEIIAYIFPKKSKDLLNWLSKHDKF